MVSNILTITGTIGVITLALMTGAPGIVVVLIVLGLGVPCLCACSDLMN